MTPFFAALIQGGDNGAGDRDGARCLPTRYSHVTVLQSPSAMLPWTVAAERTRALGLGIPEAKTCLLPRVRHLISLTL